MKNVDTLKMFSRQKQNNRVIVNVVTPTARIFFVVAFEFLAIFHFNAKETAAAAQTFGAE